MLVNIMFLEISDMSGNRVRHWSRSGSFNGPGICSWSWSRSWFSSFSGPCSKSRSRSSLARKVKSKVIKI